MPKADFLDLLQIFERALADFYDFPLVERAENFLISPKDLEKLPYSTGDHRAKVILDEHSLGNECFIGIYFDPQLAAALAKPRGTLKLTMDILDHWFVLMEELSHFHLILNRIQKQQSTKLIELEYQAELDKVLVIAKVLEEEFACLPHHQSLLQISRQASFISNGQHYPQASYLATKTLEQFDLKEAKSLDRSSQSKIRQLYNLDFSGKLALLAKAA